jgi:quinol monooxygenase YgiN
MIGLDAAAAGGGREKLVATNARRHYCNNWTVAVQSLIRSFTREETSMHTRLFHGEIQPGKEEEAWQVLNEFAHRVKQHKGCILNQVLRSGREIVGVTTWESQADLAAYADGEVARELFRRITPLFMGMPTARTYEVKLNLCDAAATRPA